MKDVRVIEVKKSVFESNDERAALLREELKNIEVGLFVYNINTYKEKLEQIIEDLQILKDQETSESQKLEEGQNKKDTLKARIDELIAEIENMQNVGFESKTKIEQLNSQINVSKERISNNATNIERLTKEIEELHQRINDFNEEKDSKVSKKDNLFKNKEKFETELKEKEEELAKISAKLSEKELEIEGKKKQVEADTDAKYERLAEINTYEINYENLEKTKKNVKQELQSTISELDSNRIKKQEISKNFQEIENTRNKAVNTLTEIKNQKEDIAILTGVIERIEADSPINDLEEIDKRTISRNIKEENKKIEKRIQQYKNNNYKMGVVTSNDKRISQRFMTGKILH